MCLMLVKFVLALFALFALAFTEYFHLFGSCFTWERSSPGIICEVSHLEFLFATSRTFVCCICFWCITYLCIHLDFTLL